MLISKNVPDEPSWRPLGNVLRLHAGKRVAQFARKVNRSAAAGVRGQSFALLLADPDY